MRMAGKHGDIGKWWGHRKAKQTAKNYIDSIQSPRGALATDFKIPIIRVIRFLEDGEYRIIRTSGDLQTILIEQLQQLSKDARDHLSMLYTPRKKPPQRRLEEDALRAYLLCRLKDRLPNRVLERETIIAFIDREALASADQRLDLKIQSPTIDGNNATVIIEVKWSDNAECATSLCEQLGMRYLVDGGLTHGIYFIGWCGHGHWAKAAGEGPKPFKEMSAWQKKFDVQAAEFSRQFPKTSILPFVVDLTW